jgi:hypothetical protein
MKFTYLGGDKCYQITNSRLCGFKKAGNEPHLYLAGLAVNYTHLLPFIFIRAKHND